MPEASEDTDKYQQEEFMCIGQDKIVYHEWNCCNDTEGRKMHDNGHSVHFVFEICQQRIGNAGEEGTEKCHK